FKIGRHQRDAQRDGGSGNALSRRTLGLRPTCRSRDRVGSELDRHAQENDWLARFPMDDWVGGRTSVMSPVGLLPMALLGFEIDRFLEGAAAMDQLTRVDVVEQNAAMLLALMWFYAGEGQCAKDMVVLPYKD